MQQELCLDGCCIIISQLRKSDKVVTITNTPKASIHNLFFIHTRIETVPNQAK